MATSLKNVLADLNSIDVNQLANDERFFELADEIRNFHLRTLPDAKRHWARTGNREAFSKLIDNIYTQVSNEKEIEIAFTAGHSELCCDLIYYEMLHMDEIKLDESNTDSPIKDKLRILYDRFRISDHFEEQNFADKVNRIFIQNDPHAIVWAINPHFERLEFSAFYKLWEQWRDEYDIALKNYIYAIRKQFLLRMWSLCRGDVFIEAYITKEAERYNIYLGN